MFTWIVKTNIVIHQQHHPRSRTLLQEEWTDLTQRVYRCGLDQKCYGSQNDLCIEEQYHYIWEQIAARDIADCSRRHWSPTCQHRRADRRRFHQGTWSWQATTMLNEPWTTYTTCRVWRGRKHDNEQDLLDVKDEDQSMATQCEGHDDERDEYQGHPNYAYGWTVP